MWVITVYWEPYEIRCEKDNCMAPNATQCVSTCHLSVCLSDYHNLDSRQFSCTLFPTQFINLVISKSTYITCAVDISSLKNPHSRNNPVPVRQSVQLSLCRSQVRTLCTDCVTFMESHDTGTVADKLTSWLTERWSRVGECQQEETTDIYIYISFSK